MSVEDAPRESSIGSNGTLPAVATIAGVEVVTIPLAEYAELLECRRRVAEIGNLRSRRLRPSPIDHDAEVAAFLKAQPPEMTVKEVLEACALRFGTKRTPSKSAAYQFYSRGRHQNA